MLKYTSVYYAYTCMQMLEPNGITSPTLSLKRCDYLLDETKMIFRVTYFTTCLTACRSCLAALSGFVAARLMARVP